MGGALILGGGTYPLKEALPAIGGRRSKNDETDTWIWQVPAEKFDALAGLCAKNSIRLVQADSNGARRTGSGNGRAA